MLHGGGDKCIVLRRWLRRRLHAHIRGKGELAAWR
jgi:hypothetical protein